MYVSPCPNRPAEAAGNFVVAQIDVRAARRADCGRRGATNLLFPFAFETLDNRAVLPFPKILKFAEYGTAFLCTSRRFFGDPHLYAGFLRKRSEVALALSIHRAYRLC